MKNVQKIDDAGKTWDFSEKKNNGAKITIDGVQYYLYYREKYDRCYLYEAIKRERKPKKQFQLLDNGIQFDLYDRENIRKSVVINGVSKRTTWSKQANRIIFY